MQTRENILSRQSGPRAAARRRTFGVQNLELAAGAIQEALCRVFEQLAKVLMA